MKKLLSLFVVFSLSFCQISVASDSQETDQVPPWRPEIEPYLDQFQIEEDTHLTCISRNGRPPAELYWFLEGEQLTEGVSQPRVIDVLTGQNKTLYTVSLPLKRRMQISDDGKILICRSIHPADQPQEYRVKLQVRFRPQPMPQIHAYGLPLGRTALLNVTITANPRPRIEWSADGKRIREGNQIERYEAFEPVSLGNNTYNVTLAIAGLTIEDTKRTYYLKAANEFGQQDYTLQIHPAEQPLENREAGFRPQPLPQIHIYGLPLGRTALLNVIIIAKPQPRIEWSFDRTRIGEGVRFERYESYESTSLGNNTYNIMFAIDNLNIEDTKTTYYLKAANEFGELNYSVQISPSTPRIRK